MNLVPEKINFAPKNVKFTVELVLWKNKIGVKKQKTVPKKTQNYAKNFLIELVEFAVSQSACDVIIISMAIALAVPRAIGRD